MTEIGILLITSYLTFHLTVVVLKDTPMFAPVEVLNMTVPPVLMFASDILNVQMNQKILKLPSMNHATIGVCPWKSLMLVLIVLIGNHPPLPFQPENQLPFITCVDTKDKKLPSLKTNLVLKDLTTLYLLT